MGHVRFGVLAPDSPFCAGSCGRIA
jgi:hypothetical protein